MNLLLQRTDDVATDADLRILYEYDPEEELGDDPIEVCAGEWRRDEPGKWRFWSHPDFED